jgi:hypothetical protein
VITRWEEIVERAAKNLGVPYEQVRDVVLEMASNTEKHLIHPSLMETDLLGIGHLEIRYGKAQKRIPYLRRIINVKKMYADRCRQRAYPEDLIKAEMFDADIAVIERDIDFLTGILELKQDIYDNFGRIKYLKQLMGDYLRTADLIKRKKKIYISPLSTRIGRKKGAKDTKVRKAKRFTGRKQAKDGFHG